ncbi:MAG: phage head closure protein [Blastomonas sp.]
MAQPVLNAGDLDRSIHIIQQTKVKAGNGQVTLQDGSTIARTRAKRMEQRIAEVFNAGSDQTSNTTIFRIRWRRDVSNVDQIVVTDGQRFEIKSVMEFGRRVGLDLVCERLGANV